MKNKYCLEYDNENSIEELNAKYSGDRYKLYDALKNFRKMQMK